MNHMAIHTQPAFIEKLGQKHTCAWSWYHILSPMLVRLSKLLQYPSVDDLF